MGLNIIGAFPLGRTYYDGQTIDTADYGGSSQLEGLEGSFMDIPPRTTPGANEPPRSARQKKGRIVRNASGMALLPSRTLLYAAGYHGRRVGGYAHYAADVKPAGVVDDLLPSTGVPNGDLFWMLTEGPALCLTDLTGGALNVITEGSMICALTAATSQATTSGRVNSFVVTNNATNIGTQIMNYIGVAMSAKTTANTNATVLVDLKLGN